MSAKSIAQLCAAKLQHFFELCKSLYRKECLSLRYGFGIPSGKSERTYWINLSDQKGTGRILGELAEMYNKEAKSTRLVGKIEEYFDTCPNEIGGLINQEEYS